MAIIWKNRKIKSDSEHLNSESSVALLNDPQKPDLSDAEMQAHNTTKEDLSGDTAKLTAGQLKTKFEALEWIKTRGSRLKLLSGYAGVGKTFMLVDLVESLVSEGVLDWDQVIGVAPTHTAVGVLRSATSGKFRGRRLWRDRDGKKHYHRKGFIGYLTLASLLSLRPSVVEWDKPKEEALQSLFQIESDELTPDQSSYLKSLVTLKKAAEEMVISFNPTQSMPSIGEGLSDIRLIVVDEASMIDSIQFSLLNELIECSTVHPDLQVIFVGDPCQLPPIKEKEGRCMEIDGFSRLTEVVRYDGPILDYCTQIRNGASIENLHYQMNHDESFMLCNYVEGIRIVADCIRNGENARIMAATNAAVDTINLQVRKLVKQQQDLFYEPGDTLITKSPIARDQYGTCRPYPTQKNSIKIHVGTSALIKITEICESETLKSPFGTTFEKLLVEAVDLATGGTISELIHVINPNQWQQWQDEQRQAFQMYMSTSTRSKKGSKKRGQEGKVAQEAWDYLSIKNWYQHKSGDEISDNEYREFRRELQQNSFALKQFADECTYSYASTVHRAQGAGYDLVLLHMDSLTRTPKGGSDATWDTRKLLYTAATRARKQLVFLV